MDWLDAFEKFLEQEILSHNANLVNFKVYAFTISGFIDAFEGDFFADAYLMLTAGILVFAYAFTFLGACSPVHLRITPACVGILCVILSYTSGMSICFQLDQKLTTIHGILPFLLIGVGCDDMFVICNAIDQTPDDLPP